MERVYYENINKWDEAFLTTGKGTGCGLCAEVCPVCKIKMEDRRPVWQRNCERCLACIHWSSCEAIEYGQKQSDAGGITTPILRSRILKEDEHAKTFSTKIGSYYIYDHYTVRNG